MATGALSSNYEEESGLPVSSDLFGTIQRQQFPSVLTKSHIKRMQHLARGIRDGFVTVFIQNGRVSCIRHAKDEIEQDV